MVAKVLDSFETPPLRTGGEICSHGINFSSVGMLSTCFRAFAFASMQLNIPVVTSDELSKSHKLLFPLMSRLKNVKTILQLYNALLLIDEMYP